MEQEKKRKNVEFTSALDICLQMQKQHYNPNAHKKKIHYNPNFNIFVDQFQIDIIKINKIIHIREI